MEEISIKQYPTDEELTEIAVKYNLDLEKVKELFSYIEEIARRYSQK